MKQLWCPSYARMIPKIADHLVLGGLSMKTPGNYQRGSDQWVAFTENINRDGGEKFPVLLTGEDPARDERHLPLLVFLNKHLFLQKEFNYKTQAEAATAPLSIPSAACATPTTWPSAYPSQTVAGRWCRRRRCAAS